MKMLKNKRLVKILLCTVMMAILMTCMAVSAFAAETNATGDVAGAVEDTWNATKGQIKQVVNNVVFPIVDLILAVLFFVKVGTAYFDYKQRGQFEFVAPCILFACLVFTLTAPLYIWDIIGM